MALTENGSNGSNGMVMPVAPMYGGGYGNGFGNFGGDGWWIILLFKTETIRKGIPIILQNVCMRIR